MNKNIKILFIVLVVLVVAAFFPAIKKTIFKGKPVQRTTSVDLKNFTKESVQKVEIKQKETTQTLQLSNGEWQINGEKASQNKVAFFFGDIANTKIVKLASKNQDNHKKFDVDKDESIVLTFTNGNKNAVFYVGKQGSQADTFYMRKQGIANVYLVRSAIYEQLAQNASDWKEQKEEEEDESAKLELEK
ncbi:MAG: DUF4340 domain-containing protein [Patescibacteria group bacterium]|nr:DUF4340 domain-containing protein [Patescibacteria group bacterium]